MFHITRARISILILLALGGPIAAVPVSAATAVLFDSIAPGVQRGTEGFGTATVLVPSSTYVTYLVRTDSRLAGRRVQIWTDTGSGWQLATTRSIEADGAVHYYARVTGRIGFWAKYPGVTPAATSHGRLAGVSSDGSVTIRLTCEDMGPTGAGVKSIASRTVAAQVGRTVRLVICSSPATGFSWGLVALDTLHLMRVGHTATADNAPGVAGTETWSLRPKSPGVGRATFVYSQPWRGGEKAAWTLVLTVTTP